MITSIFVYRILYSREICEKNRTYFIAITYASISHSKGENSLSIAYWSSDFRAEEVVLSRSVSICRIRLKDRSRFRENLVSVTALWLVLSIVKTIWPRERSEWKRCSYVKERDEQNEDHRDKSEICNFSVAIQEAQPRATKIAKLERKYRVFSNDACKKSKTDMNISARASELKLSGSKSGK